MRFVLFVRFSAWLTVAVLLSVACSGCQRGPYPTYRAGGTVAYQDGTALKQGEVEFSPIDAKRPITSKGRIQPDGTFTLTTFHPDDGAVEGEHLAIVIPQVPEDRQITAFQAGIIDPNFMRYETTPLRFTVSRNASDNQFHIVVTRPRS